MDSPEVLWVFGKTANLLTLWVKTTCPAMFSLTGAEVAWFAARPPTDSSGWSRIRTVEEGIGHGSGLLPRYYTPSVPLYWLGLSLIPYPYRPCELRITCRIGVLAQEFFYLYFINTVTRNNNLQWETIEQYRLTLAVKILTWFDSM